jgi:hypothetical protein
MSINVEGFDYDNFNPEGRTYPPNGDYLLEIKGSEEKPSKDGHRMINVHFEIAEGAQKGQKFIIGYYVGNPDAEQAKWAFEALGRLYFAATGQRPTSRGFDMKNLDFKVFNATFDATPNAKGDVYAKIKNLKPRSDVLAAQTQQLKATGTPTPSWGAPRN